MTDQQTRENWERTAAQPFVPANIAGVSSHHVSAEYRVAAALEYIAAQLGEISAKLSKLTADQHERR